MKTFRTGLKIKETRSGKFYFIIYDYLLKTKEDAPDFRHGISVFQFVKDNESDMPEAVNSTLIFRSMKAEYY